MPAKKSRMPHTCCVLTGFGKSVYEAKTLTNLQDIWYEIIYIYTYIYIIYVYLSIYLYLYLYI